MIDPSSYKAILFDVDKTLTNSNREISERTQRALQSLVTKGIRIGVCSGRHFATLQSRYLGSFPPDSVHIVSGGAQVIDMRGNVLWERLIPYEIGQSIIQMLTPSGVRTWMLSGNSIYGNDLALEHWKTDASDPNAIQILPASEYPHVGIPLIDAHHIGPEAIEVLKKIPEIDWKPMINYDGIPYADITAKGVNKSTAIQEWCRITGIKSEEIIGFGDSENDLEFLQAVGYAVAMGNATEQIKSIADEVTADCDHDGVAEWIEKNILSVIPA